MAYSLARYILILDHVRLQSLTFINSAATHLQARTCVHLQSQWRFEAREFLTEAEAASAVDAAFLHLEAYQFLAAEALADLKAFWKIRPKCGSKKFLERCCNCCRLARNCTRPVGA